MPGMAEKDVAGWEGFFQRYTRLTVRYTLDQLSSRADTAHATVRTVYLYVPAGGGAQRETRLRQGILFTRTPNGWRGADIPEGPRGLPPAVPRALGRRGRGRGGHGIGPPR